MKKEINVGKKILAANEHYALENARRLQENNVICLNMISSPGSGKTTILTETIKKLSSKLKIAVIEGDIQTQLDADRIRETGAPAIQIETEGACHLTAAQVSNAMDQLPINELDVIVIENVGNLVCPSAFELGETAKIAVLSVAEGHDKPAKYPAIFARSKAVLINKIDLLQAVGLSDFNLEQATADIHKLNAKTKVFPLCAKTGEGMDAWCEWLQMQKKSK